MLLLIKATATSLQILYKYYDRQRIAPKKCSWLTKIFKNAPYSTLPRTPRPTSAATV